MNELKRNFSIAIDGPSASGKSTIAKLIAKRLGITYIDTGAMYRAFTYACLINNFDCKDEKQCCSLIGKIEIGFNKYNHVTLNGKDIEDEIRKNNVADNVSYIASYKDIRLYLVDVQRDLAKNSSVVMDGRDIGNYVLKDANLKIFQVADVEVRAQRRYIENEEKGISSTFEECLNNLKKRDYIDSHRDFCPLKKSDDMIEINTTNLTIDEVVDLILNIIKEKGIC